MVEATGPKWTRELEESVLTLRAPLPVVESGSLSLAAVLDAGRRGADQRYVRRAAMPVSDRDPNRGETDLDGASH